MLNPKNKLINVGFSFFYIACLQMVVFLAALIDGIIKILGSGAVFDWPHIQPVLIACISAALAYLLKSLSTNSHNQLFTKEPG